jgi:hypothetical protein
MDTTKELSLVSALKDFFGFLPGQTLQQFAVEVKQLSSEDRAYFKKHLEAAGYTIKPMPTEAAA